MTTMIAGELWVSLAALVRSYASAASLNSGISTDFSAADNWLVVAAGPARLRLCSDPETGEGTWQLRGACQDTQGKLLLLPEGAVSLNGKVFDLDHAAIDFAALLMDAATKAVGQKS